MHLPGRRMRGEREGLHNNNITSENLIKVKELMNN